MAKPTENQWVPLPKRKKGAHEKELAETAELRHRFWRAAWNPVLDGIHEPEDYSLKPKREKHD